MRRLLSIIGICGILLLALVQNILSDVPQRISYQAILSDAIGAPVPDGAHSVIFTIYNKEDGGTALWSSGLQTVNTVGGVFSYELGSGVTLPDNLFIDSVRYLGITVGSDPEITPRTKLNSVPFAFHSLRADSAGSAELLDGLNSTDFATNFHNHNSDYVNLTGDVMTGSLGFNNGSFPITFIYQSGTINPSRAIAAHSPGFPDWGLMYDDFNDEFVFTGNDDTNMVVQPFGSGDNAVRLGEDAISSPEILDEPGIVQGNNGSEFVLSTSAMTDLTTVTITIPSAGYVFLQGRVFIRFTGTTTSNSASVQIDETSGGSAIAGVYSYVGAASYASIAARYFNCTAQRTYFKNAGTYTFRLEADQFGSSGTATAIWPILTAFYFPTSYGTVSTVSSTPEVDAEAKTIQINDPTETMNSTSAYHVDLRVLEIKARKAREEALRAELALQKAQNQKNTDQ